MAHDVKLTSGKGSMEKRIADRLRPSNEHGTADHRSVQGTGPTRVHTTIHHSGQNKPHGGGPLGGGDLGGE